MNVREPDDLNIHQSLVAELVDLFLHEGFLVSGAEGVEGYASPPELPNDGYGDQEDKAPDVYAYDQHRKVYIIGEAKTGAGDFETEHALTQYNVFLDQITRTSGKPFYCYMIVPSSRVAEFQGLLTHYIHRDFWHRLIFVSSSKQTA